MVSQLTSIPKYILLKEVQRLTIYNHQPQIYFRISHLLATQRLLKRHFELKQHSYLLFDSRMTNVSMLLVSAYVRVVDNLPLLSRHRKA